MSQYLPAEQSHDASLLDSAGGGDGLDGGEGGGRGAASGGPEKAATAAAGGGGLWVVWFQVRSQPAIQPSKKATLV